MKAVILGDGEQPAKSQIQTELETAGMLIAADGGALSAARLGLVPDIIIGDLDSYRPDGSETGTIIHLSDQETNDLEKALTYAKEHGVENVVVFGATGKRLDHTLKNLSVLLQFHKTFKRIVFQDRYSTICIADSPFRKQFPVGTSLSLFPLSGTVSGITTRGLMYPLTNGELKNGVQDGSSNETVEKTVEIEFKKGDLLLIINHQTTE